MTRARGRSELAHGKIPYNNIKDKAVRDAIMRISENLVALYEKVQAVQKAAERR